MKICFLTKVFATYACYIKTMVMELPNLFQDNSNDEWGLHIDQDLTS